MSILLIILFVVILMIVATVRFKIHAVFSLIAAAIISGLLFGFTPSETIEYIASGFGSTLASIGLIIAFGTVIGVFLEKNGGTKIIANNILRRISSNKSPLAMNLVGFIISIPVYCDSGFVILSSLNKALSKKTGIPLVIFAICLATGLYATHVFVPPTPGPLAAAALFEADLGLVMVLGLIVAIPVSLMGVVWSRVFGVLNKLKKADVEVGDGQPSETIIKGSLTTTLLPILIPIFLIGFRSLANYPTFPLGKGVVYSLIDFLGNPIVALLVGVVFVFIWAKKAPSENKQTWVSSALKEAGIIILITGAGGAFGNVLREADLASVLSAEDSFIGSGLLMAFLLSAGLKSAQGSSTVAIITTAAIMGPLLANFGLDSEFSKATAVLAVGAGALTVSHINDSYFWVVSQFSNLNVKEALKSHTMGTLIQGISGIILVLVLNSIWG